MRTKEEIQKDYNMAKSQGYNHGGMTVLFGVLGGTQIVAGTLFTAGVLSGGVSYAPIICFSLGSFTGLCAVGCGVGSVLYYRKASKLKEELDLAPNIDLELGKGAGKVVEVSPSQTPAVVVAQATSVPKSVKRSVPIDPYHYDVGTTIKNGALLGFTDSLAKHPKEAEQLLRNVCVLQILDGSSIKEIINSAFVGKTLSEKDSSDLASDLERINAVANMKSGELSLKGKYAKNEIPRMVESAAMKAILEEVKVAKEEKSSLILDSDSDSSTVSVNTAEIKNSPRVPAALAALTSSSEAANLRQ